MAEGGKKSEKNEDILDKGILTFFRGPFSRRPNPTTFPANNETDINFVQEKFMGQGPQNDNSAIEQAKRLADFGLYLRAI